MLQKVAEQCLCVIKMYKRTATVEDKKVPFFFRRTLRVRSVPFPFYSQYNG